MRNIFDNAKFGDRFKTKDGRLAIFLYSDSKQAIVMTELNDESDMESPYSVSLDGSYDGLPRNFTHRKSIVPKEEELTIISEGFEPKELKVE